MLYQSDLCTEKDEWTAVSGHWNWKESECAYIAKSTSISSLAWVAPSYPETLDWHDYTVTATLNWLDNEASRLRGMRQARGLLFRTTSLEASFAEWDSYSCELEKEEFHNLTKLVLRSYSLHDHTTGGALVVELASSHAVVEDRRALDEGSWYNLSATANNNQLRCLLQGPGGYALEISASSNKHLVGSFGLLTSHAQTAFKAVYVFHEADRLDPTTHPTAQPSVGRADDSPEGEGDYPLEGPKARRG